MKVLLITYSFPPAAGVGVLRAHSLARYLPESGVEVEVLTARNAAAVGRDASLLAQLPAGTVIHRSWALDLPFALRKAIKRLLSRSGGAKPQPAAKVPEAKPSKPNPLKQLVANLLLPDPQVGWLPFASRAAKRIVRRRGIDAVLITVPPFSSAMLVSRLRKAFPHLPIVLDFRDEWLHSTLDLVSYNSNARAREVASRCESESVRDATRVVCVTEAAVDAVRSRYPQLPAGRFVCIPNGYDRDPRAFSPDASGVDTASDRIITLTYAGTVYGSTDPTNVVEAVLSLPAELRPRLRLRFIGHIETPAYRATLERLGEQVELLGFMPQAEALRALEATDYVLLITHDPINVAAKLYDYISSGKPILAAVHPEGDVRRIVEHTRTGWCADVRSPQAIADLLTAAIERAPSIAAEFRPSAESIAQYHRRPLTARYAALLKSLLPQKQSAG